jgi:hypothetical protein
VPLHAGTAAAAAASAALSPGATAYITQHICCMQHLPRLIEGGVTRLIVQIPPRAIMHAMLHKSNRQYRHTNMLRSGCAALVRGAQWPWRALFQSLLLLIGSFRDPAGAQSLSD